MPRGILLVFTVGVFGSLILGGAASVDTEPAPGVLGGLGVALGPATCEPDLSGSALPLLNFRPRVDSGEIGCFADPWG